MTSTPAHQFNATLFDLVHDLNVAIPGHMELSLAENLASTFIRAQPGNRMLMDKFWELTKDKKEAIEAKDDNILLSTLGLFVPQEDVLQTMWSTLTEDNKDIVFRYLSALYHLAEEGSVSSVAGEEACDESSRSLYLVYNNMWKEFLTHTLKSMHTVSQDDHFHKGLRNSIERLESLMETKGQDSEVLYAILAPSLKDVLPQMDPSQDMSQDMLMKFMIPPDDPVDTLHGDASKLTGTRFILSRTMTMDELLESVVSSEEVVHLATYWHYLKLITFTLDSCPKEILSMMSGIAHSMAQNMVTGPIE